MSDAYTIGKLLTPAAPPPRFIYKDYLTQQDANNNYASNRITINTDNFKNGNQLIPLSDVFTVLPLNIVTSNLSAVATNATVLQATLPVALKNGYWQLLNQINIALWGTTISNSAVGVNLVSSLRFMQRVSRDQAMKLGPSLGWSKDDSESQRCLVAGTLVTVYATNNNINPSTVNSTLAANVTLGTISNILGAYAGQNVYNQGCLDRAKWLTNSAITLSGSALQINGYTFTAGTHAVSVTVPQVFSYTIYAKIRWRDMHDFFAQCTMPLKNLQFNIQITLNMANGVCTLSDPQANSGTVGFGGTTVGSSNGISCPLMLTNNGTGPGAAVGPGATGVLAAGSYLSQITSCVMTLVGPCITYYPVIQLNPAVEKLLLGNAWKRKIPFLDHQYYVLNNQANGTAINWQIFQGIQNVKKLTVGGWFTSTGRTAPSPSPFFSATGTAPVQTSPGFKLTNVNLMINGKNYYANPIQYDFSTYLQNVSGYLPGGAFDSDSLGAGQISERDFNNGYTFYTFDLTRSEQIGKNFQPDLPMTCILNATQSSQIMTAADPAQDVALGALTTYAVDLVAIVEFEIAIDIDMEAGGLTRIVSSQVVNK